MTLRVEWDKSAMDVATRLLMQMPGNGQRARNSALSTVGFEMKKKFKEAFAAGGAPGWPLAKLHPQTPVIASRPAIVRGKGQYPKYTTQRIPQKKLWGALANLIVYSVDKDAGTLEIGFMVGTFGKKLKKWSTNSGEHSKLVNNTIGEGAVGLAKFLTDGGTYPFQDRKDTEKMRRYLASVGFPLHKGTILKAPPRPIVGPVVIQNQTLITKTFVGKFWANIQRYAGEKK